MKPLRLDGETRSPKLPKVSEKAEQAAIVKLLWSIGASVYVLGTVRRKGDHPGTMQTPGIPDIFAIMPTRTPAEERVAMWIEVKRVGGKRSAAQEQFALEINDTFCGYLCGTCDDVIAFMTAGGYVKDASVSARAEPDVKRLGV